MLSTSCINRVFHKQVRDVIKLKIKQAKTYSLCILVLYPSMQWLSEWWQLTWITCLHRIAQPVQRVCGGHSTSLKSSSSRWLCFPSASNRSGVPWTHFSQLRYHTYTLGAMRTLASPVSSCTHQVAWVCQCAPLCRVCLDWVKGRRVPLGLSVWWGLCPARGTRPPMR